MKKMLVIKRDEMAKKARYEDPRFAKRSARTDKNGSRVLEQEKGKHERLVINLMQYLASGKEVS